MSAYKFKWLAGDMNYTEYGGKWYARVGEKEFLVLELMNWAETVGERAAEAVGAAYNVQLSRVSLTDEHTNKEALKACGWVLNWDGSIIQEYNGDVVARHPKQCEIVLLEAVHSYGCKTVWFDESSNNWRKLMRAARKAASL